MSKERVITHSDEEPREPRTPIVSTEIRTGPSGVFLIGAGATLLLAATAILLVPSVSPGQAWIVRSLAERGVTSLPLFAAGTLFTGLWLAVRTSRAHSIAAQLASLSNAPVIEGLSEEIGHVREVLHGMRIEFGYLKDAVQAQIEHQNATPSTDSHAEGMYRLAASLDQLGQRVEEQIGSSQRQVHEALEGISSAIEVLRHERRDGRIYLADDTEKDAGIAGETDDIDSAFQRIDGDGQVTPAHSEAAAARERLGVLDLLDDLGRMLPKKISPDLGHALITSEAFEGVQDEGWGRHDALAGPLPSVRPENAGELGWAAGLLSATEAEAAYDETAIVRKLENLRTLLADSRVREALTTMDRTPD